MTADLVEREEHEACLERLFAREAGRWEDVTVLCHDISPLADHMMQLRESSRGPLHVTWLDYPLSARGHGYCLITAFAEAWHWSSVALYNKQWFLQQCVVELA
jgi:hypothetical protein